MSEYKTLCNILLEKNASSSTGVTAYTAQDCSNVFHAAASTEGVLYIGEQDLLFCVCSVWETSLQLVSPHQLRDKWKLEMESAEGKNGRYNIIMTRNSATPNVHT